MGLSAHIQALNTAANESYPDTPTQGTPITDRGIAGARTITCVQ